MGFLIFLHKFHHLSSRINCKQYLCDKKIVICLCTFICGDMKYKCKKREYKTVSSKVFLFFVICDFVWLYFFKDLPSIFPPEAKQAKEKNIWKA